jgi:hypothetical protein
MSLKCSCQLRPRFGKVLSPDPRGKVHGPIPQKVGLGLVDLSVLPPLGMKSNTTTSISNPVQTDGQSFCKHKSTQHHGQQCINESLAEVTVVFSRLRLTKVHHLHREVISRRREKPFGMHTVTDALTRLLYQI